MVALFGGGLYLKIMETSEEFVLSDHCGQFREEGMDIKVTNSNEYNRYAYFRKKEYSKA